MRGSDLFGKKALAVLAALLCFQGLAGAPSAEKGDLTARVTDESGQPLADILISLRNTSASEMLPILARSNASGLVFLRDVAAGTYRLLVRSGKFRNVREAQVEIRPDRTELVTVMLQQILGVEVSDDENLDLDALLRASSSRRVVFRSGEGGVISDDFPGDWGRASHAVFNVSSNPGLGGDYVAFPGDSAGGALTNFAVENPLGFSGSSVMAGQLSSGEDSMWRLKNFVNYALSDRHAIQVFIGYGQLSFNQPSLSLGDSPLQAGGTELSQLSGPLRSLSVGFQDRWNLGAALSVEWGMELNHVRADQSRRFASPNASIAFEPIEGTEVRVEAASKRETLASSLELPSGDQINLSDSFYISRVGEEMHLGTARYHQASLRQRIDDNTHVEAAAFKSLMRGIGHPFAIQGDEAGLQVFQLDARQADSSGYRLTFERKVNEHLKATFTYLYGRAAGLDAAAELQLWDTAELAEAFRRNGYHSLATQVDAYLPFSKTLVTALVKVVPEGNPISTLDAYNDRYQTANESVNLFVRQIIPMPRGLFDFLGLEFLAPEQVEALLDVRNLMNQEAGSVHAAGEDFLLLQNPRTVRGGIAVRF